MTKKRRFVCVKSKSPIEPKQTQAEEKKNLLNHNKPRKTLILVFYEQVYFLKAKYCVTAHPKVRLHLLFVMFTLKSQLAGRLK